MKNKNRSGWSVPLMEMMIAVGFFIICASICVQVFAKTERLSRLSEDTSYSILMAQTIAEQVKSSGEKAFVNMEETGEGNYAIQWDADWNPTETNGVFRAEIQTREENRMFHADIVIMRKQEILYELSVSLYLEVSATDGTGG